MRKRLLILCIVLLMVSQASAQEYSWQKPHSKILPNGDLEWAPEAYAFNPGPELRYIDYEQGDDNNSGETKNAPWKHHPWDRDAEGKAAQSKGAITYVFKGGVVYRGQLSASESGKEEEPVRLTSDPSWGKGKAMIWGSEQLPSKWVKATTVKHPERLPEVGKVWALDAKAAGILDENNRIAYTQPNGRGSNIGPSFTGLFIVNPDGTQETCHLARTPDWQPGNDNFAMDYWHISGGDAEVQHEGKTRAGFKDERWKNPDLPKDYFAGGTIWIQYKSLMGTPTPSTIPLKDKEGADWYHPDKGIMLKRVQYGHGKGGLRYMIENLPQFLDSAGEFYLDYESGQLFFRPEDGVDPNNLHFEFTTDVGQVQVANQSNIEISGMAFSFGTGTTVKIEDNSENINIHHCRFEDVIDTCIHAGVSRNMEKSPFMDRIRIADCEFTNIWTTAIAADGTYIWNPDKIAPYRGRFRQIDILRNKTYNTGMKHSGSRYSNVPAIRATKVEVGEIAGNIVRRCFGSGIMVLGGKEGNLGTHSARSPNIPLIRLIVHHNKTEDTALGVNDYGGLALWQGGPTYCYNNNVGNSPGHMPAGLFGGNNPVNLSYPLYLDGAFKQYSFNNIIWGRTTDPDDPFANTTSAYFMVFGFLNQFANNTVYRSVKGIGGSSGNRNDIVGNVFAEISKLFLASNRIGDPSLAGGGDDASSGLRGVPSLAYARNIFHGDAEAGFMVREKEQQQSDALNKPIEADTIEKMAQQMQAFPLRNGSLGEATEKSPIKGAPAGPLQELSADVSFAPVAGSKVIDAGGTYFVPWSLYGTVGEWHFTENHKAPNTITDYHWYMSEAHFHRSMYEYIPSFDLTVNTASLNDYVESPSEDWCKGAFALDGSRAFTYPDDLLRQDIRIKLKAWDRGGKRKKNYPEEPWTIENDEIRYPAPQRKTLVITSQNLLVEAIVKVNAGNSGSILSKYDGKSGYMLSIGSDGKAAFTIGSNGQTASVATAGRVNDGGWHHIIAEIDRESGRMTIYLDGQKSGEAKCGLAPDASIDSKADFVACKGLTGAIDFIRVCRGTLEDSHTNIAELYEWQTNGPFRYDFLGNKPRGRRDAGAIEYVQ
ncbi:MAG: LamG-like jellyroll fold domain-containing protein [Candidatus Sumerlaeia bacterium]